MAGSQHHFPDGQGGIPGLRLVTQLAAVDLLDGATLARFSRPARLQLRLVNSLPALRRLGWILRYRF